MAPLDPASKSQVMTRLKDFCSDSVVLVSEAKFLFNPVFPVLMCRNSIRLYTIQMLAEIEGKMPTHLNRMRSVSQAMASLIIICM